MKKNEKEGSITNVDKEAGAGDVQFELQLKGKQKRGQPTIKEKTAEMINLKDKNDVIGARLVSVSQTQELAFEKEKRDAVSIEELTKSMEHELKELKVEKEQLVARVKELETEVYEAFTQGFDQAVSQVRVLFSETDVKKLDVTKVVVNEKLVDDDAMGKGRGESSSIGEKEG
ncbi:hypothetical protein AHAS_Ahas16G0129500 [Arachis hypogaea]